MSRRGLNTATKGARGARGDEAEKPFWISFSDMMTAMMVLFLVVMAVALLAVTKTVSEKEQEAVQHQNDIDDCMTLAEEAAELHPGVKVDPKRHVVDFGDRARFGFNSAALTSDQAEVLRTFVPELLYMARQEACQKVLKRVVVEGYTDQTGSYLSNLNLSLQRSQRVLCSLLDSQGRFSLSDADKRSVRDLFWVGGFAFNSAKSTDEESRRVEMRLEFLGLDERKTRPFASSFEMGSSRSEPRAKDPSDANFGKCNF